MARASSHQPQASLDKSLFDAPAPIVVHDEVLLVSTRSIGTVCDSAHMNQGLQCHRLVIEPSGSGEQGTPAWKKAGWKRVLSVPSSLLTIVYVHGNRVGSGKDISEGMKVYRSFKAHNKLSKPVRFIIWSWPSGQIPGPIKDYLVKARRTTPVAWQLAWFLDQLPAETSISLFGYSYGTRVVSGATHLLAGGRLGELRLNNRVHPQRPPVKAALLAAAYDADWIQPGNTYGRSLVQTERMVLATNELDPAMRFYHLSNGRGRMHALGKSGVSEPRSLGTSLHRLGRVDFTKEVGRSHALVDYLAADKKMAFVWRQLTHSSIAASNTTRPLFNAPR